jgi:hypothetical protein
MRILQESLRVLPVSLMTAIFALASLAPVTAVAVGGGISQVGAGVAAEPDLTGQIALNMAAADGGCNGVPVLSMACTATAAGAAHYCVDVTGSAFGFPISAHACADAGGAGYAAATGSLTYEKRLAHASAVGHYTQQEFDHWRCALGDPAPPACNCPAGGSYGPCLPVSKTVHRTKEDHRICNEENNWIVEDAVAIVNGQQPAPWHLLPCASAAFVAGVFDCIDGAADANDNADGFSSPPSSASLPSCKGKPTADNSKTNVAAIQSMLALSGAPNKLPFQIQVSQLPPDKQLELRHGLLEAMKTKLEDAIAAIQPIGGRDANLESILVRLHDQMILEAAAELATDFDVLATPMAS